MKHTDKIEWMKNYANELGVELNLEGSCGLGRECVGIVAHDKYPDYEWYNEDYDEISGNGDVWYPEDAYHKHPCVAVLGRGEEAESQLYDWLVWFKENNFKLEIIEKTVKIDD